MDLKETIKLLRGLHNPKEDYAEIVGAPLPDMYGRKYVFPEPEDYAIEAAVEALEKVDKYKWHDLRENPDDLPEEDENRTSDNVLVVTKYGDFSVAYIDLTLIEWCTDEYTAAEDIIAWKYIEPFEKSVSEGDD